VIQKENSLDIHSNFWLSAILVDPDEAGFCGEDLRHIFTKQNIESRPLWKPMHMQPLYHGYPYYGDEVSQDLFEKGLCLPSGSNLKEEDLNRIEDALMSIFE